MRDLINAIRKQEDCVVYPSKGQPALASNLEMPKDLIQYFNLCSGMELFKSQDYSFLFVSPADFVCANQDMFNENLNNETDSWYIVARNGGEWPITVDLGAARIGYCYDSFWERHATTDCEIIATSFKELLTSLFLNKGQYPYWLQSNSPKLGYALDNDCL